MERRKQKSIYAIIAFSALLIALICYLPECLSILGWLFYALRPVTLGLLFAFVLSVPQNAIEKRLERVFRRVKRIRIKAIRPISVVLTLVFMFSLLFLLIIVVVPQIMLSVKSIIASVPEYIRSVSGWIVERFPSFDLDSLVEGALDVVSGMLSEDTGGDMIQNVINGVAGIIGDIVTIVIAFIIAVYVLFSKEKLSRYVRKLLALTLRPSYCDAILRISRLTGEVFSSFVGGQALDAAILGVMCYVGMMLLGLPYAPAISVLVAVTALIPMAGSFIGEFIGALLLLMTSPINAIIFVAMMLVLQQIEGMFIYPRIVGNSVKLSPLLVLSAVVIGGNIAGVLGALLGVPIAALIFALIKGLIMAGDEEPV